MNKVGKVSKMQVVHTSPITYALPLDQNLIPLNPYIGKTCTLRFMHKIQCMNCDKVIKKAYQDGFCFPCTQKLARCDLCIVKPERCHFHLNTCREPLWGQQHCMIPHVVYLAYTSGLKVGITRQSQLPIRWIDQGALLALPLFEVGTRRISGYVESEIAKGVSDKTDWRRMLQAPRLEVAQMQVAIKAHAQSISKNSLISVQHIFSQISPLLDNAHFQRISEPDFSYFTYPILEYPQKIISLSFDKTPVIEGTLLGIKGQYLIFDKGVLNIRKHSGYIIEIE